MHAEKHPSRDGAPGNGEMMWAANVPSPCAIRAAVVAMVGLPVANDLRRCSATVKRPGKSSGEVETHADS